MFYLLALVIQTAASTARKEGLLGRLFPFRCPPTAAELKINLSGSEIWISFLSPTLTQQQQKTTAAITTTTTWLWILLAAHGGLQEPYSSLQLH